MLQKATWQALQWVSWSPETASLTILYQEIIWP